MLRSWREVLETIVERYQKRGRQLLFRADSANEVLQERINHLLKRSMGRPPQKPNVRYHDFQYQAGSWDHPRRVAAKVEWHQGELFPRVVSS